MATNAEIEGYVKEIEKAQAREWERMSYPMDKTPTFTIEYAKRFAKIVRKSYGSTSVHCFVEISSGDIYKAATWKAPAKGVRGNIANEKKPLLGYDYYLK